MRSYSFSVKSHIRRGSELAVCLIDLNAARAGRLSLKLNGEVMQDRANDDSCFRLARLLEWFTVGITLVLGDVVIGGIARPVNRVVADQHRFHQRVGS